MIDADDLSDLLELADEALAFAVESLLDSDTQE
jgi:predicted RNase H-like HicB family nuclease